MDTLIDELRNLISHAPHQYNKLILLLNLGNQVSEWGFKDLSNKLQLRYINLGLSLSKTLLDFNERQRALKLPRLVNQIIEETNGDSFLINNIEILFQPDLQQDPMRLLQGLSRNILILAVWNGQIINDYLVYAEPYHPEYRKYPIRDLNIFELPKVS